MYFPSDFGDFHEVSFSEEANFFRATFWEKADFSRATFKFASNAWLRVGSQANFSEATFGEKVDFTWTTFTESINLSGATFKGRAAFYDVQTLPETEFNLSGTIIEKLEHVSFHSTPLRPSWFVDVDAQKFDFSDVEWFESPFGDKLGLEVEIDALKRRGIGEPESSRKLTKACRRLMNNAEENRDYPTANAFHYWSMEVQRKEAPLSAFAAWRLTWWYWALSGYGERPARAAMWLLVILLSFAGYYMLVGPEGVQKLSPAKVWWSAWESVVYSLSVMTRLRGAIPVTEPVGIRTAVILEGVLGPFQIALFALALRRKFMR